MFVDPGTRVKGSRLKALLPLIFSNFVVPALQCSLVLDKIGVLAPTLEDFDGS